MPPGQNFVGAQDFIYNEMCKLQLYLICVNIDVIFNQVHVHVHVHVTTCTCMAHVLL